MLMSLNDYAALRAEFEMERRELAKVHRRALQSATADEAKARKQRAAANAAAASRVYDAAGSSGESVVTRIFAALAGPADDGSDAWRDVPPAPPPRGAHHRSTSVPAAKKASKKSGSPGKRRSMRAQSTASSSDGRWRTPTCPR